MQKIIKQFSCLIFFVIPFAVGAQSPPFVWGHVWPVGAKGLAMGGAFTAVSDDYTALNYNPAGMGQIKSAQIGGAFSFLSVSDEANYLGKKSTDESNYTKLHALGFVLPIPTVRGSLVLGFSYHRVQDFDQAFLASQFVQDVGYEATWQQARNEEGALSNTSIGAAVEMAPGLYLGGALNIWGGSDDYTWQFAELDPVYDGEAISDSTSTDHVLTEFSGVNLTFSTLFKMNDHIRVGAAVQTPITLKSKESWDYSEIFTYDDGHTETNYTENGQYEYRVQFPWLLRGGIALSQGPVLLSADVTLKNYSQMRYKSDPPAGVLMGEANLNIKQDFQNTMDYGVGCQIQIPRLPIAISGGYAKVNAPYKQKLSKEDRTILSGGVDIRVNPQAAVRISYAKTSWETTVYDPTINENINQKLNLGKALFSILYLF